VSLKITISEPAIIITNPLTTIPKLIPVATEVYAEAEIVYCIPPIKSKIHINMVIICAML